MNIEYSCAIYNIGEIWRDGCDVFVVQFGKVYITDMTSWV